MEQYIKKSALVAEIKRLIKHSEMVADHNTQITELVSRELDTLYHLISFTNSLEVKEVDNVWHDASETPKGAGDKEILVQFADSHASVLEIDDWEYLDHQTKWAYLKDLI